MWVALKNNAIVGFVSIYLPHFIHHLFVDPCAQKQGVGALLLKKAEENLKRPMELKIALDNKGVCRFYQKQGWVEISLHDQAPEPYLLYRKY